MVLFFRRLAWTFTASIFRLFRTLFCCFLIFFVGVTFFCPNCGFKKREKRDEEGEEER
jgi:hypothetical protein